MSHARLRMFYFLFSLNFSSLYKGEFTASSWRLRDWMEHKYSIGPDSTFYVECNLKLCRRVGGERGFSVLLLKKNRHVTLQDLQVEWDKIEEYFALFETVERRNLSFEKPWWLKVEYTDQFWNYKSLYLPLPGINVYQLAFKDILCVSFQWKTMFLWKPSSLWLVYVVGSSSS